MTLSLFRHGQNADNLHKSAAKSRKNPSEHTHVTLCFAWEKSWWRGQDLNLRPLGYEGDGGSHVEPLRATYSNKNAAFPPFVLLSVALSCHQFPHNSRTV